MYSSVLTTTPFGISAPSCAGSQPGHHCHWQQPPEHPTFRTGLRAEHSGVRSAQLLLQQPLDWNNHEVFPAREEQTNENLPFTHP